MALLIEPAGVASYEVTVAYAIEWCRLHKGWRWERIGDFGPHAA